MATWNAASSAITAKKQKASSAPGPILGCRPPSATGTSRSALPRIQAPLLLIQGAEDEYGTPAQVEAIAKAAAGPVESHLLPGCGHVPHHQVRERVLDLTADFVGRRLVGAAGATG